MKLFMFHVSLLSSATCTHLRNRRTTTEESTGTGACCTGFGFTCDPGPWTKDACEMSLGGKIYLGDDSSCPNESCQYEWAKESLEDKYPWAFDEEDTPGNGSLFWATEIAKVVFSSAVNLGFQGIINAVFGENTVNALSDIANSLDEVKERMEVIEEAIRRLEESSAKTAFIAAEGFAKTYARDIRAYFKLVDGWEKEHEFDDSDVQILVSASYIAIEQLETHLLGPDTGAVKNSP